MPISASTKLGHYEVVGPLGAGGMGVVYRAHDHRLGRDVAVKVLPEDVRENADRRRRFEDEARAAGGLSHPNLLTVLDVGEHEGAPYLVCELLEGSTLRELLERGALAVRRALAIASQLAAGLAAAHERGIVHRDLKPENVFISRDDHAKILDFGLAKTMPTKLVDPHGATLGATAPGTVMGSVGYMAPEQLQGEVADARSDLFALGAILYEALSGRAAFPGKNAIEVGYATLRDEPAELPASVPPAVARLVARCLEKMPDRRFQSARDLGFALDTLATTTSSEATVTRPRSTTPRSFGSAWLAGAVVVGLAAGALAMRFIGSRTPLDAVASGVGPAASSAPPATASVRLTRLTFRQGTVMRARFAPDGATTLYSAAFGSSRPRTFATVAGNPEGRAITEENEGLLAVSRGNELALRLPSQGAVGDPDVLARAPLAGGAPRAIDDHVSDADWTSDGSELVVIRNAGSGSKLEFPIGTVILESEHRLATPRVSRDGLAVAVTELSHPSDSRGSILIVRRDKDAPPRRLGPFAGISGLAWSPDGTEIWAALNRKTETNALDAIRLDGSRRPLLDAPGELTLLDVAPDGRALITASDPRHGIAGVTSAGGREVDFSWFDGSDGVDLSRDGTTLLFYEAFAAAEPDRLVYVRDTRKASAVKLGIGVPLALSPDKAWALVSPPPFSSLVRMPIGAGTTVPIPTSPITRFTRAFWFADGKRMLVVGGATGRPLRVWLFDRDGGAPRPLTEEGVFTTAPPSPDGTLIVAIDPELRSSLVPIGGGPAEPLPGLAPGELPIQWSDDGKKLFVRNVAAGPRGADRRLDGYITAPPPARVSLYDRATRKQKPWREIVPADATGIGHIDNVLIAADGAAYAYSYVRRPSTLYEVAGLK